MQKIQLLEPCLTHEVGLVDVKAAGDEVVALGRYAGTARATGKPLDVEWNIVWKMRAGKVVYSHEYTGIEALAGAVS